MPSFPSFKNDISPCPATPFQVLQRIADFLNQFLVVGKDLKMITTDDNAHSVVTIIYRKK